MSRWHNDKMEPWQSSIAPLLGKLRICSSHCLARGLAAAGVGRHLSLVYKHRKQIPSCFFNLEAGFLEAIVCPCDHNFKLLPCPFWCGKKSMTWVPWIIEKAATFWLHLTADTKELLIFKITKIPSSQCNRYGSLMYNGVLSPWSRTCHSPALQWRRQFLMEPVPTREASLVSFS